VRLVGLYDARTNSVTVLQSVSQSDPHTVTQQHNQWQTSQLLKTNTKWRNTFCKTLPNAFPATTGAGRIWRRRRSN